MKINFDACFYTDGDFNFDEERLNFLFDKNSSMYKGAKIDYFYSKNGEEIYIRFTAEGLNNACRWALRDLLEGLMCSIRTIKYYLVEDLYNLIRYFHKDLWKELNQEKTNGLSGNYDNTCIVLKMEE